MNKYLQLLEGNFYTKGVINCPVIEDGIVVDHVDLIQKNEEKLNYVINMIRDMDIENKLRLAICMFDNYSHTNLEYDKKEMYHLGASIKDLGKNALE